MKEELYPFRDLGYREIGEEESGVTTRELARLRAAKRTCGSIELRFQRGIKRADPAQREIKNDPVSGSRPEGR
jgi:hypothetical protein